MADLSLVKEEIGKVVFGQERTIELVLCAILSGGHALLIGAPGLAKTRLIDALGTVLGLGAGRVQFTPDLMPSDILGSEILEQTEDGKRSFRFVPGPVFTSLLLADEINRATPKTQSALLEAMQERQVTISGTRRPLPQPFFVMATQNPLESEGTYPLPEAQLDRFFFKVAVPFPSLDELVQVMDRTTGNTSQQASAVLSPDELQRLRHIVREVAIVPEVMRYAMRLVLATHPDLDAGCPTAKNYLRYGASPRGAQTLVLGARVQALLAGRQHASIADVRAIAVPALRHRVGRSFEAEADGLTADELIRRVLAEVPETEGRVAQELRA